MRPFSALCSRFALVICSLLSAISAPAAEAPVGSTYKVGRIGKLNSYDHLVIDSPVTFSSSTDRTAFAAELAISGGLAGVASIGGHVGVVTLGDLSLNNLSNATTGNGTVTFGNGSLTIGGAGQITGFTQPTNLAPTNSPTFTGTVTLPGSVAFGSAAFSPSVSLSTGGSNPISINNTTGGAINVNLQAGTMQTVLGNAGLNFISLPDTGAVATGLLSYVAAQAVMPQEFGALADGSHDDGPAIQAALDTGRSVYLPEGIYKITTTLQKYSIGQWFLGAGRNRTFLRQTTAGITAIRTNKADGQAAVFQWRGLYNGGGGAYFHEIGEMTIEGTTPVTIAITGVSVTASNTAVTCTSTTGLVAGQYVRSIAPGVPSGDTIASVTDSTHFVLTSAATATVSSGTWEAGSGAAIDCGAGQAAHFGDEIYLHDLQTFQFDTHIHFASTAQVKIVRVSCQNGTLLTNAYGRGLVIDNAADPNSVIIDGYSATGCTIGAEVSGAGCSMHMGDMVNCTLGMMFNGLGKLAGNHWEGCNRYISIGTYEPTYLSLDAVDTQGSSIPPFLVQGGSYLTGSISGFGPSGQALVEVVGNTDHANIASVSNSSNYDTAAWETFQYKWTALGGKSVCFSPFMKIPSDAWLPSPSSKFLGQFFEIINGSGSGATTRLVVGVEDTAGTESFADVIAANAANTFSQNQTIAPNKSLILGGGNSGSSGSALNALHFNSTSGNGSSRDWNLRPADVSDTGELSLRVSSTAGGACNVQALLFDGTGDAHFYQNLEAQKKMTIGGLFHLTPQTAPGSPAEGDIYADSGDHHLYFYNGSAWKQLDN